MPVEKKSWTIVKEARRESRMKGLDMIEGLCTSFYELHGDRYYGDDQAVIAGLAYFEGIPVTVIAQQKGKNYQESVYRRNGMALPEGYRKALRLMKQAEKFNRPILCFVDTPGAYPGLAAEQRGQAEAIARNLQEMAVLSVPIITVVIGEGGSGGALALSIANSIFMLEYAIYSVVSPEGCASILWKDAKRSEDAAECLKLTSEDLAALGIVDVVISEAGQTKIEILENIKQNILSELNRFAVFTGEMLKKQRMQKFRNIGILRETEDAI